MTSMEGVKKDMNEIGLQEHLSLDTSKWRNMIFVYVYMRHSLSSYGLRPAP